MRDLSNMLDLGYFEAQWGYRKALFARIIRAQWMSGWDLITHPLRSYYILGDLSQINALSPPNEKNHLNSIFLSWYQYLLPCINNSSLNSISTILFQYISIRAQYLLPINNVIVENQWCIAKIQYRSTWNQYAVLCWL